MCRRYTFVDIFAKAMTGIFIAALLCAETLYKDVYLREHVHSIRVLALAVKWIILWPQTRSPG